MKSFKPPLTSHRDEFTTYDEACLTWIFRLCRVGIAFSHDPGEWPSYADDDLAELEDKVKRLVRKAASN